MGFGMSGYTRIPNTDFRIGKRGACLLKHSKMSYVDKFIDPAELTIEQRRTIKRLHDPPPPPLPINPETGKQWREEDRWMLEMWGYSIACARAALSSPSRATWESTESEFQ